MLKKKLVYLLVVLFYSCKSLDIPLENKIDIFTEKPVVKMTDEELKSWYHKDITEDTIPGVSAEKLYKKLQENQVLSSKKIIVAVLDSGIDIDHEDLNNIIWQNSEEIENNGIDDDNNGYIDDIHGWNFLGNSNGKNVEFARKEFLRILVERDVELNTTMDSISKKNLDTIVIDALNEYKSAIQRLSKTKDYISKHKIKYFKLKKYFYNKLPNDSLTIPNLSKIDTINDKQDASKVKNLFKILKRGRTESWIQRYEDYISLMENYKLNPDYQDRRLIGDNLLDINDRVYGNNDITPQNGLENHGTMVAGLIAANRTNDIGIKGLADNVLIMPLRVIPNGDEYDKDVALAIRYAVDNGAKVINMSFGKRFSPNKGWVYEAIKYAAKNEVLIVRASGNVSTNIDEVKFYPNDNIDNKEISDNFISVGASNYKITKKLPAYFSNYGKMNVDIFAPGYKIYTTSQGDKYEMAKGTSLATPIVSGVAAILFSRFKDLSASQVKNIILESGNSYDLLIRPPGRDDDRIQFSELSKSGKTVNAFNAFLMAEEMTKGKK